MSRVLRYEIPVDRAVHVRILPGPVLHVTARRADVVELWCQDRGEERRVELHVVGTAHPWPAPATYVGTALAPDDLVWHLLALGPSSAAPSALLHGEQILSPEDHLVFVTRDPKIHTTQLQDMAARLPAALHGRVLIVDGNTFDVHVIRPEPPAEAR